MKLLLPLKHYDEAGRIKPALALYLCIGFLSRSLMIFAGSFSMPQYGDELLTLFYPQQTQLYIALLGAMSAVLAMIILGFREKIWTVNKTSVFLVLKPLLMVSVMVDLVTHVQLAENIHWMFSWSIAIILMLDLFCVFYIVKDKHIKMMIRDWRTPQPIV